MPRRPFASWFMTRRLINTPVRHCVFDTGQFALETHLPEIVPLIAGFLDRLRAGGRV